MTPRPPRLTPVFLESPYAGDVDANVAYLRACMRDCLRRGEAPFASHGLYTQPGVLRDDDPDERALGIRAGFAWRPCAERTVVYTNRGVSAGMDRGIEDARELVWQPIEYRTLGLDVPIAAVPPGELAEVHAQLTERETLRARVRELEADAKDRFELNRGLVQAEMDACQAAERKLAAANALLDRARDEIDCDVYDDPVTQELVRDINAHLPPDAEPAAPTDGTCKCGSAPIDANGQCATCADLEPAPTRTETDGVEQTWFSIGGARISLGSIKAALSLAGMVVHQFAACPACGPGPCTPACPEREWRYKPAAPTRKHCGEHAGWRSDCERCAADATPRNGAAPEQSQDGERLWRDVPARQRARHGVEAARQSARRGHATGGARRMTIELAVAVALAIVAGVARWHVCRQDDGAALRAANAALERGRERRAGVMPGERLHVLEWALLVVVGLMFLSWAAVPIIAEFVGAAR